MRRDNGAVRDWTQKLSSDTRRHVQYNRPLWNSMSQSRHSNLTLLMNVNLSVLPVEQNMPIATAELNFHQYVNVC